MYSEQTRSSTAVQTIDTPVCGRILVVDDDRTFGGFMTAALESEGHYADWAGCMADGLASLYAQRYDMVVIDLRLPDGSGLGLLRDATDEGLLHDTAAIIMTGHDFEQPSDIRVVRKSDGIERFLGQVRDIVAQTKKRRGSLTRPPSQLRGVSHDHKRPGKAKRIELVLYTSPESEGCRKALRTIRDVLDGYDKDQVDFSICDLSGRPSRGDEDSVVFTPTLVKRGPGPRTWIIGNIDQPSVLVDLLEVSGVDRKKN